MIKQALRNNRILLAMLLILLYRPLSSVPAFRTPITITQPDGSTITVRLYGDEYFSYRTTTDGYLVAEDNKGYLNYAKVTEDGSIITLNMRANNADKRTNDERKFVKSIQPVGDLTRYNSDVRSRKSKSISAISPIQKSFPLNGTPKSIVILVNFTDKSFVVPNPNQAYTNLLNQKGYSTNGGTGSARDYFIDNSMGTFQPQFDVYGPYTLPNNIAYYGGNGTSGGDQNPRQMIIDACTQASNAGVDFTQYDTDNDGYVDNVFVYYAGYNEAEGASTNTVWPHRWVLANTSTKFNGKIVYDYACTSELKGTSGSNMCGIGTFTHEFGHVLGLPDFYATNSATHHTLYSWDIMDYGPYNNSGRTPPNYSSYERFFMGWLTPTEIKSPKNLTLDTLSTSNQAFLISQTGTHNLNGENPSPTEFFMLENRQKSGWDKYLPGHGLLITHVFYNASTWAANTVNNTSTAMGVDIVEADGLATDASCAGDPFPGTSNINSYSPTLRAGTDLAKPLTSISETNGIISFVYMGGVFPTNDIPVATAATNVLQTSLSANWNACTFLSTYLLDVFTVNGTDTTYLDGYKAKNVGNVLTYSITGLSPDITYNYRLRATDGTDTTAYSNVIMAKTSVYTFDMFKPSAIDASSVTSESFVANWSWPTDMFVPDAYFLTVYSKVSGADIVPTTYSFDNTNLPDGWLSASSFSTTNGYFGNAAPSVYLTTDGGYLQTPVLENNIRSLQFWYRGRSAATSNSLLLYSSVDGNDWKLIKTINPLTNTEGVTVTLSMDEIPESNALKFVYSKSGTGYVAIDDIVIGTQTISNVITNGLDSVNVGNTNSYKLSNLSDSTKYFYYVSAIKDGVVTGNSNTMSVITLKKSTSGISELPVGVKIKKLDNVVQIFLDSESESRLQLYNVSGQKLFDTRFSKNINIPFNYYPKGGYILKLNNTAIKLLW